MGQGVETKTDTPIIHRAAIRGLVDIRRQDLDTALDGQSHIALYLVSNILEGIHHGAVEFRAPVASHVGCNVGNPGITGSMATVKGITSKFLHLRPNLLGNGFGNTICHTTWGIIFVFPCFKSGFVSMEKNLFFSFHNFVFLFRSCYPAGFLSDSSGAYDFAHTFVFSKRYDRSIPAQPSIRFHPRYYVRCSGANPRAGTPVSYRAGLSWRHYILYRGSAAMRYGSEQFLHCQLPRR